MKITVTQEHIDKGTAKECSSCPLALAFQDCGYPKAEVGIWSLWLFGAISEDIRRWDLPKSATKFISEFDEGGHVEPFTFEMDIPTC